MKHLIILGTFILYLGGLSANGNSATIPSTSQKAAKQKSRAKKGTKFPKASQYTQTKLEYKIIPADSGTHGYEIYSDGRIMIKQTSVPALPSNLGFRTTQQAEDVAKLVIAKIKKGEMPPTITVDELKKLGIN